MRIFESLSEIFYSFVMNTRASDYKEYFQNGHNYCNGMEYLFIALLLVPLCFCLYFYYVQAANLANGTKKNYIVIFLLGFLTLLVVNFVLLSTCAGYKNALTSGNMWKVNMIDVIYYPIMYQLYSWFAKSGSKVRNIDLISCFSK